MNFFIGIDFSMAKPAATLVAPDNSLYFFAWPEKLTNNAKFLYSSIDSENFSVKSREIGSVSNDLPNSQHVYVHVIRATNLAKIIIDDLKTTIKSWLSKNSSEDKEVKIYIATEGLSFNSKGKSTLDLATYKGIFLSHLVDSFKSSLSNLYTYAPMTMKAVAGCSKSDIAKSKNAMVQAFINDVPEKASLFRDMLAEGILKKKNSESWLECVDDIVDSYWAYKTMILKENL